MPQSAVSLFHNGVNHQTPHPTLTSIMLPREDSPLITQDPSEDTKVLPEENKWSRQRQSISAWSVYFLSAVGIFAVSTTLWHAWSHTAEESLQVPDITVAMIGNSMIYFNDFPRLMEVFSQDRIRQNSCLHGGASISSLLIEGNGMYPMFQTNASVIDEIDNHIIYDYGACTVPQLLLGHDDRIYDPGYAQAEDEDNVTENPCRVDAAYFDYAIRAYNNTHKHWDYVLINDNTRNPSRASTREHGLATLDAFYVAYFKKSKATPIFLWTHAYESNSTDTRNMTGLEDVANFTSLTGAGYRAYVKRLAAQLPASQRPRIAPVGLAYLVVHEENLNLWHKLFHCDHVHASPYGSFLQACIVYHTLYGRMPPQSHVVLADMAELWSRARMMQHAWEPPNPFPHKREAQYLYNVADRVVRGYKPKSYIDYRHGEVAYEG